MSGHEGEEHSAESARASRSTDPVYRSAPRTRDRDPWTWPAVVVVVAGLLGAWSLFGPGSDADVPDDSVDTADARDPDDAGSPTAGTPSDDEGSIRRPDDEPPKSPSSPPDELSAKALAILNQRCRECHGIRFEVPGFNVLDHEGLLAERGEDAPYVIPGKADDSYLWERIDDDSMPEGGPPLTEAERSIVRNWITEGAAPFPVEPSRDFVPLAVVWNAVRDDLRSVPVEERRFARYLSLRNLHNDSAVERIGRNNSSYSNDDLRLARAAVGKLVNSLSWEPDIVAPTVVEAGNGVVLRLDVRDYGWDEGRVWQRLVDLYPYGLDYTHNAEFGEVAAEVYEFTGTKLPVLRADWFVDTAPRPDLYYPILGLPDTIAALEKRLGVDAEQDFVDDRLRRAGFSESGVSANNRVVDRHPLPTGGVYWKSYDFGASGNRGNLFRFPLGPQFTGNPFAEHAFSADGGEMIFSLPNGLQAYFLTDPKGERLNEGPVKVVNDSKNTSGGPEVVNAISCMACHQQGMIRFRDTVRDSDSVPFGEVRAKTQRLFAPRDEMEPLVDGDEARFLAAVERAVGADDDGLTDEPVGKTARLYQRDLEVEQVAADLGVEDPSVIVEFVRNNKSLREDRGLGPLIDGNAIKRSTWSDPTQGQFHALAQELEIGAPLD